MNAAVHPRPLTDYDRVVRLFARLRGITIEDVAAGLGLAFRDVATMVDNALERGELVERPKARNATGWPCEILLAEPETAAEVDIRDVLQPAQRIILRELMTRRTPATESELRVVLYGSGDDRSETVVRVIISQMRQRLAPYGIDVPAPRYRAGWSLTDEGKARVRRIFGERW